MSWQEIYKGTVASVIKAHGHAVQYVLGGGSEGPAPFAYTVGLHAQKERGYELALSGLPPVTAVGILNDLAAALARGHSAPREGLEVGGLLQDGFALRLRRVSAPGELALIEAMYRTHPPVWQALWPDTEGRFPGDPGYSVHEKSQDLL